MSILLERSGHMDPNADDFTQIGYAGARFGAGYAESLTAYCR